MFNYQEVGFMFHAQAAEEVEVTPETKRMKRGKKPDVEDGPGPDAEDKKRRKRKRKQPDAEDGPGPDVSDKKQRHPPDATG